MKDFPQCGHSMGWDESAVLLGRGARAPETGASGTFTTIGAPGPGRRPDMTIRPPQILQVSRPPCGGMRLAAIEYFS